MYNSILINIINVLTGVVSSYIVWYLTFKILVPKIHFSNKISRVSTTENNSKYKYRFKFENCGHRDIIDLEIIVKLRIKGLSVNFPENWHVIYLPTSTLDYKNVAIVRPISKKGLRVVLEIKTYESDYFKDMIFPSDIRTLAETKSLTLEDVMNLGKDSELQIFIFGTDEFSGSKKFFESKIYKYSTSPEYCDIIEGKFERGSLNVNKNASC